MQTSMTKNSPEPHYEPQDFCLRLSQLFGEQITWAILKHPRKDVAILEVGTGATHDRNNATWRRIDANGVKYIKPAGEMRWQIWGNTRSNIDSYSQEKIQEQFELLELARSESPLTHSMGCLFQGRPLEPIFYFVPKRLERKRYTK